MVFILSSFFLTQKPQSRLRVVQSFLKGLGDGDEGLAGKIGLTEGRRHSEGAWREGGGGNVNADSARNVPYPAMA